MDSYTAQAQPGVISDPTTFAEYLTFVLVDDLQADAFAVIADNIINIRKSIGQKDPSAGLSLTLGISHNGWKRLLPDRAQPRGLVPFEALHNGDRTFPSTPGDVFCMIKSERMDLNFQASRVRGRSESLARQKNSRASPGRSSRGYQPCAGPTSSREPPNP